MELFLLSTNEILMRSVRHNLIVIMGSYCDVAQYLFSGEQGNSQFFWLYKNVTALVVVTTILSTDVLVLLDTRRLPVKTITRFDSHTHGIDMRRTSNWYRNYIEMSIYLFKNIHQAQFYTPSKLSNDILPMIIFQEFHHGVIWWKPYCSVCQIVWCNLWIGRYRLQGPFILTWFNFNRGMDN